MIIFLSCTKRKQEYSCKASEMYQASNWFSLAYKYAKSLHPDKIYILSAKYGLLNENDLIAPYEKALSTAKDIEIRKWSTMVAKQIRERSINYNDRAIWLCGKNYRKYIARLFPRSEMPISHLQIGEQMAFFKRNTK